MHRDVLRRQRQHLRQRRGKAVGGVRGESRDQIHIDCHAAHGAHPFKRGDDVRRRVPATDGLEHRVRHGLRVHADPVHAVTAQDAQLLLRDRIRTARLDGVFAQGGQVKPLFKHRAQPVKLRRRERGRRTAAHVDRHGAEPQRSRRGRRSGDLLLQRRQKGRDQLHALFHRLADEAAVGAAGRAEGNAHIEADVLLPQACGGLHGLAARVEAERRALRGDVELLDEAAQGLLLAEALPQLRLKQLPRPHAGQRAPDGLLPPRAQRRAVHGVLYEALAFPVLLQRAAERRKHGGGPA